MAVKEIDPEARPLLTASVGLRTRSHQLGMQLGKIGVRSWEVSGEKNKIKDGNLLL